MKAAWIFTPCIVAGDGSLAPYFPAGTTPDYTNPLEIHRLTGSPAPHVHFLAGAVAAPNMELADNHWHAVLRAGDFYAQWTINATPHAHDDGEMPSWFMPFVVCSDADAAALVADPACHLVAECPVDAEGHIGPEDDTPWTSQQRTAWAGRVLAAIGLQLPAEVDRPSRLVLFVVGLNARRYAAAAPLRPVTV